MSNTIDERTVFVDGFTVEPTDDALTKFFSKHGKIKSLHKRNDRKSKQFKGSIMIEFETLDDAKSIIDKKLKYEKQSLTMKPKTKFIEEANNNLRANNAKKRDDIIKTKIETAVKEFKYDPGCLIHITDIGPEKVVFTELKDLFKEYGVAFVAFPYNGNRKEAMIRFHTAASAKIAMNNLMKEDTQIGGQVPKMSIMQGDEEKQIIEKMIEHKARNETKKKRGTKRKNETESEQPAKINKKD